jgi:hypothetical protein
LGEGQPGAVVAPARRASRPQSGHPTIARRRGAGRVGGGGIVGAGLGVYSPAIPGGRFRGLGAGIQVRPSTSRMIGLADFPVDPHPPGGVARV